MQSLTCGPENEDIRLNIESRKKIIVCSNKLNFGGKGVRRAGGVNMEEKLKSRVPNMISGYSVKKQIIVLILQYHEKITNSAENPRKRI